MARAARAYLVLYEEFALRGFVKINQYYCESDRRPIENATGIYNQFKQKYNHKEMLGVELASTYWHFVDVLWLLLFLFFNFFR